MRHLPLIALLCLVLVAPAGAQRIRTEDVPTRPGVRVRVLTIQPAERPVATLIVLPDGTGNLGLTTAGRFARGEDDPLVRARLMLARAGLAVVVADIAPDLALGSGVVGGYRTGEPHGADLGALIRHFRKPGVPVALAGTGRAALSVAAAAARLSGPARPDALVLVSAHLLDAGSDQPSVERGVREPGKITIPVLALAHQGDGCRLSPPAALSRLRALLPGAAPLDARVLAGGRQRAVNDPCAPAAAHGFPGLEQELADTIAGWLKGLPRP